MHKNISQKKHPRNQRFCLQQALTRFDSPWKLRYTFAFLIGTLFKLTFQRSLKTLNIDEQFGCSKRISCY